MKRLTVLNTPLDGLKSVSRKKIADTRGYLSRLFCLEELEPYGWSYPICQINFSKTLVSGAIRGLHFQYPPVSEVKLVSCLQGEVWDVAVDIRNGSPTFLRWHAQVISATNQLAMWIPEGFAHGFQVLSEGCELIYFHSQPYSASLSGGLNPYDPALSIGWPLPVKEISTSDANHAMVGECFKGVVL